MVESKSKKRMLPAEIANRFSSKADFLRYFREQSKCPHKTNKFVPEQLFVPPETMVNKDFLKAILADTK